MQPNYLSTPHDRATLVAGIRLARQLAATRALAPYVAGEYRPGRGRATDDDLLEFARNNGGDDLPSERHAARWDRRAIRWRSSTPSCACTASTGLRVVDCGIMPTLVSGNTNAPVIMIAEKAADMILRDAR